MDYLANGEFCANNGDERCPAAVDGVIRQGLPMLAAAGGQADFAEVSFLICKTFVMYLVLWIFLILIMQNILSRLAMPGCQGLALKRRSISSE